MARVDYWNHNVHYQPVILRAVPPGCGAALEVGCGDGLLASRLAERCAEVTAIDRDARMIALARSRAQAAGPGRVTVVEADYLAYPVADASFDFACANTSLHHMDFTAALAAMARALAPRRPSRGRRAGRARSSATTWPTRPGSRPTWSTGPSAARVIPARLSRTPR